MKTDRIFVLLLVVMLPMSGCFDDAVGDGEGTDDSTSGNTVINNYYNNTTILQNEDTSFQFIAFSETRTGDTWGFADNGLYTYDFLEIGTFNTSSNSIIEVISASAVFYHEIHHNWYEVGQIKLVSICNGIEYSHHITADNSGSPSSLSVTPLKGTLSADCEFNVTVHWFGSDFTDYVFNDDSTQINIEIGFQVFSASPVTSL